MLYLKLTKPASQGFQEMDQVHRGERHHHRTPTSKIVGPNWVYEAVNEQSFALYYAPVTTPILRCLVAENRELKIIADNSSYSTSGSLIYVWQHELEGEWFGTTLVTS